MKKIAYTIVALILLTPSLRAQDKDCYDNCHNYYSYNMSAIQEQYFYSTAQECTPYVNDNQGDYAIFESYYEGMDLISPLASLSTLDQFYDCTYELYYQTGMAMEIIADTFFDCMANC